MKKLSLRSLAALTLCAGLTISALSTTNVFAADTEKAKENYNEGLKSQQAGNTTDAAQFYLAAITLDPSYIDAYINLGAIYFEKKDYQNALVQFRTATEKDKSNATAFANLGRVESALKKYVEAEAAIKTAISLDGKNADLYKELGKVYFYKNSYTELIETLKKCHEMGAGDQLTWYMLGKGYKQEEQYAPALEALNKSISIEPKNYQAYFALGQIYQAQEKFDLAASSYKKAHGANPKKHLAMYNYAIAIESANPDNFDKRISAWEEFVRIAKNDPLARKDLAFAEDHLKELRDGKKTVDANP
jgi:superkiller protein 3